MEENVYIKKFQQNEILKTNTFYFIANNFWRQTMKKNQKKYSKLKPLKLK